MNNYDDIERAVLYVRFSSNNQTEQSIEGQVRVCQKFCDEHGIQIINVYADRATSAHTNIEKRVQFLKMIDDSAKGHFDAVVVYSLDRFSRSRYDMANFKFRLKKNGVRLISATEPISDDPNGIILESVLEGMAEFYSAELSQKINRGLWESAYKHNTIGGHAPLGYKVVDKKLVIDEETAHIVREAFELYADGKTVGEISNIFNAKGYRTSKNAAFGRSSFSKMFRNKRYIGTFVFHDYEAENAIPPIIDMDLWNRVQDRLQNQKPAGTFKAKVPYILTGKVFCAACGCPISGDSNSRKYYYSCYGKRNRHVENCNNRRIQKDYFEDAVAKSVLSMLTDVRIEEMAEIACEENERYIHNTTQIPELNEKLQDIDKRVNNIMSAIEAAGEAPETLVGRIKELESERKALANELAREESRIVHLEKERVIFWLESFRNGDITDEKFKRRIVDLFVREIILTTEDDGGWTAKITYNLVDPKDSSIQTSNDLVSVQILQHNYILHIPKKKRRSRWDSRPSRTA